MMNTVTNRFAERLSAQGTSAQRRMPDTLQVNLGKLCNQACKHCHVDAGPGRTENMEFETVERLIVLLKNSPSIQTVDLTGGAPELNPHFRELVLVARTLGKTVIDRCNLTVLFEPGQETTAEFLRNNQVQITASLPCYSLANVDRQRGTGSFDKSVQALKILNQLGYGKDAALQLNLVYNPLGASLPPDQMKLEADYRRELETHFGIVFSNLFALANMPIKRFKADLERNDKLQEYEKLLEENFNGAAAENIMCRNLVSVGWDGSLYDCDFNQMLDLPLAGRLRSLWDIESLEELADETILFDNHCFGCTAGAGSSCQGKLV
jgi:radical SAM/Cys-rich protein